MKIISILIVFIFALVFTCCKKEVPVVPKKEKVKLTVEEYVLKLNDSPEVLALKRGEFLIKVVGDQTVATSHPIIVIGSIKDSCSWGYLANMMRNVSVKNLEPFWIAPKSKTRIPIENQMDFDVSYYWYERFYILESIVTYEIGDTIYYVKDGKFVGK